MKYFKPYNGLVQNYGLFYLQSTESVCEDPVLGHQRPLLIFNMFSVLISRSQRFHFPYCSSVPAERIIVKTF